MDGPRKRPTFSVLMASYNHERFVGRAIETVLGQTFEDLELLIVDDASTDGSVEIIKSYMARDPRIKARFHEVNMGISRTMNDAQSMATGEYLALFASDDEFMSDKLEKQLAVLEKEPDAVVWADAVVIDDNGELLERTYIERFEEFFLSKSSLPEVKARKKEGFILNDLLKELHIVGQSMTTRLEHMVEFGWDESIPWSNDYLLFVNLAEKYPFRFIDEPLARYRVHSTNTVRRESERVRYPEQIMMRHLFLERFAGSMPVDVEAYNLNEIGNYYYLLGNDANGRRFLLHALSVTPFDTFLQARYLSKEFGIDIVDPKWRLIETDGSGAADTPAPVNSEYLSLMRQGAEQAGRHEWEQALWSFEQAVLSSGGTAASVNNVGVARCRLMQLVTGLARFEDALLLDDRDKDILYNHAACLASVDLLEEADDALHTVLEIDPLDQMSWRTLGLVSIKTGDIDRAESCFLKSKELSPEDDVLSCFNLAGLYCATYRYEEADRLYEQALEADPGHALHWLNKAQCKESLGEPGEALFCYFRALSGPGDDRGRASMAYTRMGRCLGRIGDLEGSFRCFERALDEDPEDVDALVTLGEALLAGGRPGEALAFLDRAIDIDPWASDAHALKGDALRRLEGAGHGTESWERSWEIRLRRESEV
jgi:tetratricopeptide (TPR) repeat protein/glycosyltransferase involved in cell wall biosynthesis